MKRHFFFIILFFISSVAFGRSKFSPNATYSVCFTPGDNCAQYIIDVLSSAKDNIYIQAYSFTSQPIALALIDAQKRGVHIEVILDKSQYKAEKYSSSKFLHNHGISVKIDAKPAIAHSKIIIADDTLITGSFNFTKAAQEKNAENIIILKDPGIIKIYLANWHRRNQFAIPLESYTPKNAKHQ